MRSLYLLDPYRAALASLALDEGLATETTPGVYSREIKAGRNRRVRDELLQLLVLYDDVATCWGEPSSQRLAAGIPAIMAGPLRNLKISRFIEVPAQNKWFALQTIVKVWESEKQDFDTLYPIILDQLSARGTPIHYSLVRLVRAYRLREVGAIPLVMSVMPRELSDTAHRILAGDREAIWSVEYPILNMLLEVRLLFAEAISTAGQIAATPLVPYVERAAPPTAHLFEVVVSELLEEGLRFPQPRNLSEALELRARNEIADFRHVFFSWLDTFMKGDVVDFVALRHEVRKAARAFRRLPNLQRFVRVSGLSQLRLESSKPLPVSSAPA